METQQPDKRREADRWQEAAPDGPAVFLVDQSVLDMGFPPSGGWVRLDRTVPEIAEQISQLVGRSTNWIVVDQIGLGPILWDEADISGLLGLADGGRS